MTSNNFLKMVLGALVITSSLLVAELAGAPELLRVLLVACLAGFLVAVFVLAGRQAKGVWRLCQAIKAIGEGDFSVEPTVDGNDDFALITSELKKMAASLRERQSEIDQTRARFAAAVRLTGESLASALERDALLEITLRAATDGVGADRGRIISFNSVTATVQELTSTGPVMQELEKIEAAERRVLLGTELTEISHPDLAVLAHELPGLGGTAELRGVISIARYGEQFSVSEKELFSYLVSQAALSLENIALHETVQRQAVTDELTGLSNHRRFGDVIATEIGRSKRFGTKLALVMLDVDDFKLINDTYGHVHGDHVLREIARVLRESSRTVDEPARYGGEELIVALPQTDLDGAYQFAERVRTRISALEIPVLGSSKTHSVTASFGVATLEQLDDQAVGSLIALADRALYAAKRRGKNRTAKAPSQ